MRRLDRPEARRIAADWHGGMTTALYALASSGSTELHPGEGIGRLQREINHCRRLATGDADLIDELDALARWVADAGPLPPER